MFFLSPIIPSETIFLACNETSSMVAPSLSVSGPLLVSKMKIKISQNNMNFSNKNVCLFVTVFPSESQSPCRRVARLKMTEAGVFCTESSSMGLMTCQVINVVLAYYHLTSKSSSPPHYPTLYMLTCSNTLNKRHT